MSKSAAEQYQIKKKRKNNNNNNSRNKNKNNNKKLTNKNRQQLQQQQQKRRQKQQQEKEEQKYQHRLIYKIDENLCAAAIAVAVASILSRRKKNCIRDRTHIAASILGAKIAPIINTWKMPLSQGYYVKSALATKRGHLGTLKGGCCNETNAKRRANECPYNNNNNNSNQSTHYAANILEASMPILTTATTTTSAAAAAATTPMTAFACTASGMGGVAYSTTTPTMLSRPLDGAEQQFYNTNNGQQQQQQQQMSNINASNGNTFQLYYLLGESLALDGQLERALDFYESIANSQLDGVIPIDKLSVISNQLITQIRQLGNNSSNTGADIVLTGVPPIASMASDVCTPTPGARQDYALETIFKSRYASRQERARAWSGNVLSMHASTPCDNTIQDEHLLDLHAPTRELRVPSPINTDDYDPLLCPLCRDILRCPVTTNCGHTFCRQCCETITMCNICHIKFPRMHANDSTGNSGGQLGVALTTTTTAAANATTNNGNIMSVNYFNGIQWPTSSVAMTMTTTTTTVPHRNPRLTSLIVNSPITVTTTTVASTTSTATTTMASTSAALGSGNLSRGAINNSMKFMQDVLVRRLVEKWWGADLQAKNINEKAASCMHYKLFDDALKFCNDSLKISPTNFKSLCLRAEVLLKLCHYQSSLSDVENALKMSAKSAKAYCLRALALSGLGRLEEALHNGFLAICLDKSTNLSDSKLFQNDLAKILQRLLAQTPKCKLEAQRNYATYHHKKPYSCEQRRRKRIMPLRSLSNADIMDMSSCYADIDADVDIDMMAYGQHFDYIPLVEAEHALYANAHDFIHKCDEYELHSGEEYELKSRRYTTRKHSRRRRAGLHADDTDECRHFSKLLRSIIKRTQLELQRLSTLEKDADMSRKQLTQVPAQLIEESDFECVLCYRVLWKPVVTPCGHTYCMVCLDRCMDYQSECPLCKSPLVELNVNGMAYQGAGAPSPIPFALAKRPATKFLEAAMKRFIADKYEERFRKEIDMEPSVPIFVCTEAFPSVPCPLFVSEPRYRLMVRRAVESGEKTFGIVQPHRDIGTILDIRDCVLLGDGCFILSTVGCKRFKILARSEKDGYETAKVEYISDEPIADQHVKFVNNMHTSVLGKAKAWFDSLSTEQKREILQSFGEMPTLEDSWEMAPDGPAWAWWTIALLPLWPQLKVEILATTSFEKRLRAIEKTLDLIKRQQQQMQQQQQQQHHQMQQQQQQNECDDDLQNDVVVDVEVDVDDVDVDVNVDVNVNEGSAAAAAGNHMTNVNDLTPTVSVDECCLHTNEAHAPNEQLLL